jgi:hypothetical protein
VRSDFCKKVGASDTKLAPTWSECNYRTWKNPVISMVLAQQARGFYPIRYDN